jgi:FKBP-type peptidyl-prolyl cis-trans isomerase 2
MKINDDKTLKLSPEESYGKRNKEFLKIIPFAVFKKSNLRPMVD